MRLWIWNWTVWSCATLLLCVAGCDKQESGKPPTLPRIAGDSAIRGRVTFKGTRPEMKEIPNEPCHAGAPSRLAEETVVVGAGGGLKNVFVRLEGAPQSAGPEEAAVLDQVNCRYVPHVLGVTVGQTLVVRSSDATMHNVHLTAERNPPANFGMTGAGQERTLTFTQPEVIRAKCDVHPWMTGYVIVCENPFFAVTGDDGLFEIHGLPAGRYKLTAWHEMYGKLEQPITVADKSVADVVFEYAEQ